MKNLLLLMLLITTSAKVSYTQVNQVQTIQVQQLKTFSQKGTKLFVKCECWEDNLFEQDFLIELRGKGIWTIVNNANEADFILDVNAWFRPQVAGTVYEAYVLVYDNADHLLCKSDLYLGQPTVFNGYDPRKALVKNLINDGLLKEIPKSKWIYSEPFDLLGYRIIAEDKYKDSEDLFWKGVNYFNQYSYKEAIKLFTKALSLNPHNTFTYEYRALAFYNLSEYGDARKDVITAMKLNPISKQNDTTYYNIMISKNNKLMRTWGPRGTIARITGAINTVTQAVASPANIKEGTSSQSTINQSTRETKSSVKKQQICTFCNGTGKNPAKEYPSEFGLGHSYQDIPCDICGGYTNHYHKPCPSCGGKGYKILLIN